MKKVSHMALGMLLFSFISCKKECYRMVTVLKDCTGTYLQIDGKDHRVCNAEKVSSFANGTVLNLTFNDINSCRGSENEEVKCSLFHKSEGWVEVLKIE